MDSHGAVTSIPSKLFASGAPGETQGCPLTPEGSPGPWAALASLCLDSPENNEILAFEPRILF